MQHAYQGTHVVNRKFILPGFCWLSDLPYSGFLYNQVSSQEYKCQLFYSVIYLFIVCCLPVILYWFSASCCAKIIYLDLVLYNFFFVSALCHSSLPCCVCVGRKSVMLFQAWELNVYLLSEAGRWCVYFCVCERQMYIQKNPLLRANRLSVATSWRKCSLMDIKSYITVWPVKSP